MQRQSLGGGGSPGSKVHLQGGVVVVGKDEKKLSIEEQEQQQKRKDVYVVGGVALEEEKKLFYHNHRSLNFKAEKSIHLIPILILLCLLVLYLCSYDPPKKDLIHFNGFVKPSKKIDSVMEINDLETKNSGNVLGIRSHRSLQEVENQTQKYRLHRKLGDF